MKSSILWYCLVFTALIFTLAGCGGETAVQDLVSEAAQPSSDPPLQPTNEPLPTPPPDNGSDAAPTNVPTPPPAVDNNPELTLPFFDDFNDGLDPAWRVINGSPLVVEGRLTVANNELSMEVGNTALKHYNIEVDIGGEDPANCRSIDDVTFGFSPTLHYVYHMSRSNGYGEWYLFEANDWEKISESEQLDCGHFRIIVNDNKYQIFINGQLAEDLIFEPAEGPLLVRIKEGAFIDNLSISP